MYCPNDNKEINDKSRNDITSEKIYTSDVKELCKCNVSFIVAPAIRLCRIIVIKLLYRNVLICIQVFYICVKIKFESFVGREQEFVSFFIDE